MDKGETGEYNSTAKMKEQHLMEKETIAAYATIDIDAKSDPLSMEIVPDSSNQLLPALVVKDLTTLPVARSLLQKIRSVIRQNTLATFLGTILILPVSSGLFITMGGSFPAPWHVGLASLPGLLVSIANAVRMGREFLAPRSKKTELRKEGVIHEP